MGPVTSAGLAVINPATEEAFARISLGSAADVDRAAAAARRAFATWSQTSVEERLGYLRKIIAGFKARLPELARMMTLEMGAPITFATERQATVALFHFEEAARVLESYRFEEPMGRRVHPPRADRRVRPDHAVELAAQPDRLQGGAGARGGLHHGAEAAARSRRSARILFAEVMHEAGVPPGVFNLVNGDGPTVGAAMSSHPEVDMVSFTGSTARRHRSARKLRPTRSSAWRRNLAASRPTSCCDDADLAQAVLAGRAVAASPTRGQSCNAPTRMLVPRAQREAAVRSARRRRPRYAVGDPLDPATTMGPVVSKTAVRQDPGR